jgi:hypothetical protein
MERSEKIRNGGGKKRIFEGENHTEKVVIGT